MMLLVLGSAALRAAPGSRAAPRRPAAARMGAPSVDVWNDEIREAWTRAYSSVDGEHDYEITEIEGTIPADLRGSVFRNGPGNFERGGERFEHVLDGDGLICRFSIDGASGRAHFKSSFVRTPDFVAEEEADAVLFRNTFGTQPAGMLANVGKLVIKNVANTNVQSWGGRLLALWEAALPCRLEPSSLRFEGLETFGDTLPDGGMTVTSGVPAIDQARHLPRPTRRSSRSGGSPSRGSPLPRH